MTAPDRAAASRERRCRDRNFTPSEPLPGSFRANFICLSPASQRLWMPAYAGMTRKGAQRMSFPRKRESSFGQRQLQSALGPDAAVMRQKLEALLQCTVCGVPIGPWLFDLRFGPERLEASAVSVGNLKTVAARAFCED